MAIIVKCLSCRKRIPGDTPECPFCRSTQRQLTIDYRPHGRYGKRERMPLPESMTDIKAAERLEKDLKNKAGRAEEETPANDTVDELFKDYLAWYKKNRRPRTYEDVSLVYETHLSRILGKYRIYDLRSSHLDAYQTLRLAETLRPRGGRKKNPDKEKKRPKITKIVSNRTVNKELDYFSGFLTWCRKKKKLYLRAERIETLPYEKPIPVILSPAEIRALVEAANPFYRALILCFYALGLRFSAATHIRLNDIDWQNKALIVQQKGGGFKLLPIGATLLMAFEEIVASRPKIKLDDYIFLSEITGRPIVQIRPALKKICEKAGIKKRVYPHLFRHSCATHLTGQRENIRIVQDYMDHKDIRTTEGYTHIAAQHLQGASDIIEDILTDGVHKKLNNNRNSVHTDRKKANSSADCGGTLTP